VVRARCRCWRGLRRRGRRSHSQTRTDMQTMVHETASASSRLRLSVAAHPLMHAPKMCNRNSHIPGRDRRSRRQVPGHRCRAGRVRLTGAVICTSLFMLGRSRMARARGSALHAVLAGTIVLGGCGGWRKPSLTALASTSSFCRKAQQFSDARVNYLRGAKPASAVHQI
jgi:hypothetical protein